MAKSKLVAKIKLKKWAKPIAFTLCLFGFKNLIGRWMFDIKVVAE